MATTTLEPYGIAFHLATTPREWASLRRRIPGLPELETQSGLTCQRANPWTIAVYIAPGQDRASRIDTIAHEAAHVAAFIYDTIGAEHTDEPFAWLMGYLVRWLDQHTPEAAA